MMLLMPETRGRLQTVLYASIPSGLLVQVPALKQTTVGMSMGHSRDFTHDKKALHHWTSQSHCHSPTQVSSLFFLFQS